MGVFFYERIESWSFLRYSLHEVPLKRAVTGDNSMLEMIVVIILIIGIPALISYAIRILTGDNIASYLGTIAIVAFGYIVVRTMFGYIINGDFLTVGLILAVPSMLGAVIAQTVYYLRLPTRKF